MADLDVRFARDRYAVWRSLVTEPQLSLLYRYARRREEMGGMAGDTQVPGAPAAGGDFIMDGLLADLQPLVETVCRLPVFPTYSYFRIYRRDDSLAKHTDRPACEISVTLCLGYLAERAWPIWINGPSGTESVDLLPGDGLFYRGIECAHWREPFQGEHLAQVFLHYVDQHGPHADWKYDKRDGLAVIGPYLPM